jgi:hypothetical protein
VIQVSGDRVVAEDIQGIQQAQGIWPAGDPHQDLLLFIQAACVDQVLL